MNPAGPTVMIGSVTSCKRPQAAIHLYQAAAAMISTNQPRVMGAAIKVGDVDATGASWQTEYRGAENSVGYWAGVRGHGRSTGQATGNSAR